MVGSKQTHSTTQVNKPKGHKHGQRKKLPLVEGNVEPKIECPNVKGEMRDGSETHVTHSQAHAETPKTAFVGAPKEGKDNAYAKDHVAQYATLAKAPKEGEEKVSSKVTKEGEEKASPEPPKEGKENVCA